ncbi:hypothetical protein MFLO_09682 [Listeria floridensis FSL S10-1187]|uniref:MarR family transcriptional regulator n=1 Tax=Listeria floridensis FSL S10-1187 TaxID=1265817 RepID=A0ABN0REC8_9LIST|nr:DUF3116 family protein [Listeria floridensis]EUJ30956.1 hypothetical protein MFLO_09682 [Listeria floridensis FSL S10-1187]
MEEIQLTELEIEVIKRVLNKDFHTKNLQHRNMTEDLEESEYTLNDVLYTLYRLEERGIIERSCDAGEKKTYLVSDNSNISSVIY